MADEFKESGANETADTPNGTQTGSSMSDTGILAMQGVDESGEKAEAKDDIIANRIEQDAVREQTGKDTIWDQAPVPRGRDYETVKEANIAGKYPVIDDFDPQTGTATSLKTIDLNADSYQDPDHLHGKVKEYSDKLSAFEGATWGGHSVPGEAINHRVLQIGVPLDSAGEEQLAALEASDADAQKKGVDLVIEEVA